MPNDIPQKPDNHREPKGNPRPRPDAAPRFSGVSKPPPRPPGLNQSPSAPQRTERTVMPKGYREMAARDAQRRKLEQEAKPTQETMVFKTDGTPENAKEDLGNTQILRNVRAQPSPPESESLKGEAPETTEIGGIVFAKRKSANTGCLRGAFYFVVVVFSSLYLSIFGWNCVNDVLALIKTEGTATITVPEGYTISEISQQLFDKGVIEQKWLFTFYCNQSEAIEIIETGTYEVPTNLDYRSIVYRMRQAKERVIITVVLREGLTLEETVDTLAEAGVSNREALMDAIAEIEFNYSFLQGLPMEEGRLEGYLYPDKYDFYSDEAPRNIINKLLRNFDRKLVASMRKYIEEKSEYSLQEILTIASMIQAEAANVTEMREISSVIHNRLKSNSLNKLQIDATLVYIIGREKKLTQADIAAAKDIDNPYNTYMYEGLPPGPICNPSIDAIRAALYPAKSGNYYYALTDEGVHKFVTSESEHNKIKRDNPETYPDYPR